MTDKTKIAFVLPTALQHDLKQTMLRDGYDLKGKSRWVTEAITALLMLNNYPELVKLNDEMKGFEKLESVVITRALKRQLGQAIIQIRKSYPDLEGVQSRIVRTAIVQRLLGLQ